MPDAGGFKIADAYVGIASRVDQRLIRRDSQRAGDDAGSIFTNAMARRMAGRGSVVRHALSNMFPSSMFLALPVLLSLTSVMAGLAAAAVALGGSLGLAAAGLAAIIPAAISAFSALATVRLALGGVMGALKAHSAQQNAAAAGGVKAANIHIDNARRIRDAQEQLADARQAQERTARDAVERVHDAERRLTDAQQRAAETQRDLNDARRDAAEDITELSRAVSDAAVDEEEARARLARAQLTLQQTTNDPKFSPQEQEEARVALMRAELDLEEAITDRTDVEKQSQQAMKRGVEGHADVVDAKRQLRDADEDLAEAERDLGVTRLRAAEDAEDAAIRVARAARGVSDARQDIAQQAGAAGGGINQFAAAMSKLTPEGRAFVHQVIRMKDMLDRLRRTAERTFLPGLTYLLKQSESLFPIVNQHIANMGTILGKAAIRLGDLIASPLFHERLANIFKENEKATKQWSQALTPLVSIVATIAEAAGPLFTRFATFINDMLTRFDKFLLIKRETGELQDFFTAAGDELAKWGRIVGNIIGGLAGIFIGAAGPGRDLASSLEEITAKFREWALSDEGQQKVRDILQFIIDLPFGKILSVAAAVAALGLAIKGLTLGVGVIQGIASLAALGPVGIVIGVVAVAVGLLAAAFIYAYTQSETFREAVQDAFKWVKENVLPIVKEWWRWFQEKIIPVLAEVAEIIGTALMDGLEKLKKAWEDNQEEIETLWGWLQVAAAFIAEKVYPVVAKVAAFLIGTFFNSISMTITVIGFLVRTAKALWQAFQTAKDFIGKAITSVKGFVSGLWSTVQQKIGLVIGKAKELKGRVVSYFGSIGSSVSGLRNKISDQFNRVVSFVKGLPGRIRSATRGMWDGIKNAFRGALNTIVGWWNRFSFSLSVPDNALTRAVGLAGKGFTVNTPNIPYFHQGGISDREQLAVLRRDEGVFTADQMRVLGDALRSAGRGGTTYVFQPGAITLDASKVRSVDDLLRMVEGLKSTARQYGAKVAMA